jgi:hypothetical protein
MPDFGAFISVTSQVQAEVSSHEPCQHETIYYESTGSYLSRRVMAAIEMQSTREQLDGHISSLLDCAGTANMSNARDWGEVDFPTCLMETVTEVGILKIHKKRFIKTVYSMKCLSSNS